MGTATITAALIAADSVGDSAVDAFALQNWGRVDITITVSNRFFPEEAAARLAVVPSVGVITDGVAAGIDLGSAADLSTRQGTSGVTIVGFDPATQRPFGAYAPDGPETLRRRPWGRPVLLSRALARRSRNEWSGDPLTLRAWSRRGADQWIPVEFRVDGVARLRKVRAATHWATSCSRRSQRPGGRGYR